MTGQNTAYKTSGLVVSEETAGTDYPTVQFQNTSIEYGIYAKGYATPGYGGRWRLIYALFDAFPFV